MSGNAYRHIRANGIDFAYLERRPAREDAPLALCLHGFPDSAHSFDAMLPVLAEAGYHAVAPFMRGYFPSGLAPDGDYAVTTLARDALALIGAFGRRDAVLIGHDWGGFAAYTAANLAPEKIRRLVVMAVPHMGATRNSLAQLRRSWYVWFFQLPRLPEKLVPRNDFAFIDRLYRNWSPNWDAEEFRLEPVKRALRVPGGLQAALGYYRRMIRGASKDVYDAMSRQTGVPALWIAGEVDGSIGLEVLRDTGRACTDRFEFISVPVAGHFVHREAPSLVHRHILEFLA